MFAKEKSVAGVREALFARRTAGWWQDQLWGAAEYLTAIWKEGLEVQQTSTATRSAGLMLRNTTAIPFDLRVLSKPAWLRSGEVRVGPGKTVYYLVSKERNAPAAATSAEIELEITNFHLPDGKNLSVILPVRFATGS